MDFECYLEGSEIVGFDWASDWQEAFVEAPDILERTGRQWLGVTGYYLGNEGNGYAGAVCVYADGSLDVVDGNGEWQPRRSGQIDIVSGTDELEVAPKVTKPKVTKPRRKAASGARRAGNGLPGPSCSP
jgi:hypothetical protein